MFFFLMPANFQIPPNQKTGAHCEALNPAKEQRVFVHC